MSVAVNFIRAWNGSYMKQIEFAEAPLVGDQVALGPNSQDIVVITKRMWRDGGLAIDCYFESCR